MKHLTDSALNLIDRASSKLGPLSTLLDAVVEKIVPTVTASACAGAVCAFTTCTNVHCSHFFVGTRYFSTAPHGCEFGIYTCSVSFCGC